MADLLEAAVDRGKVAEAEAVEEDGGEEEEEEEEEEPRLKYNRFNKELVKLLGPQSSDDGGTAQGTLFISCIAVHSKASTPCICISNRHICILCSSIHGYITYNL